ncbi:hypothetical protein [Clostridium sp. C105KSO13]|uniref:hypothetical protein n=1 Tax=Clostridium sp. C105KSO13 TaxID=1776045 RepID=UPI0007408A36|nr:hypothetical protein [Clostridium sp. C105KSO13]CUX32931.1 hypothetical protein BN3456_01443 [Clostridium sp. C105KSO13]
MSIKKIGIVIYGVCKNRSGFWEAWTDKAKELICMIGYPPTHAGISGTSLSENLRTLQRSERKMRTVIANGEPVCSLSIYSLPKNYHTALDSNCWLCINDQTWNRYSKFAYCEMNLEESSEELIERIKSALLDFIEMEQCEIFTMDKSQVPFNYVIKGQGNDVSKYPTLDILLRTDRK